jgi:hypothetical protein
MEATSAASVSTTITTAAGSPLTSVKAAAVTSTAAPSDHRIAVATCLCS